MATLILEHDGRRCGGELQGRMVIGRRQSSQVIINDRSVSRVHAWVGRVGQTYFIADSGSRTGTIVNGRPVEGRRTLHDGDQILIGPARLFFHSDAPLPPGIEPLNAVAASLNNPDSLADSNADTLANGMPSPVARRAPATVVRNENQPTVSTQARPPEIRSMPLPAAASETRIEAGSETACGACQSSIGTAEKTISCPECGVSFHANCWTENRGCSSYGCKQVGVLDQARAKTSAIAVPAPSTAATHHGARAATPEGRGVQWSYLLLPASGLAGLAGMFAFGVPSLGLLLGMILYDWRHPVRSRAVVAAALIISAISTAAGSGFSAYWWLLPGPGVGHR